MPFDEAWLRAYQTKRAAQSVVAPAWPLRFTLSRPVLLLNILLRMHWPARRKYQQGLSAEIAALIPSGVRPPLERATVTVVRYSVGTPDPDAVTPKALIDCLLVRSERHPHGLGLIVDDDPAHLTLHVQAVVCATRKEQRTEVTIEPV